MIQLYFPVLFSSCWRGRGLRQASTLHHDQTIMSQHAEWRHRRSGRWPIRSRAIDISYYRFLFPCEAGNKSTRANSKIFHGQGHIGEVFAAAEVCRAHRKIKQVQFVLQFCSLVFLQTVVCVLCVCVVFFHLPSCVYLAGIRSWDTNLIDCNLDQELKLFVSRHSARFSADVKGKPELEEALIAQLQSDDDCSCICKPNLIHTFFPPPSSLPPPPALSLSARVEKYRCVPGAATAHLKF